MDSNERSLPVQVWKRESGQIFTNKFVSNCLTSQDRWLRLGLSRNLKTRYMPSTVSFGYKGRVVLAGHLRGECILWDVPSGRRVATHKVHSNEVTHAKILPATQGLSIVSCGFDGNVVCTVFDEGRMCPIVIARHNAEHDPLMRIWGYTQGLAINRGIPHIIYNTSGEDGAVKQIDLRTPTCTTLFKCRPMKHKEQPLLVRVMESTGTNSLAVGGKDSYIHIYDVRRPATRVETFCPNDMRDGHGVVNYMAYSSYTKELLATYQQRPDVYVFEEDRGLGSDGMKAAPREDRMMTVPQKYISRTEYGEEILGSGISFMGATDEYIVSGSACGMIFIWKKDGGQLVHSWRADNVTRESFDPNPHVESLAVNPLATVPMLASCCIVRSVKIWTPEASK